MTRLAAAVLSRSLVVLSQRHKPRAPEVLVRRPLHKLEPSHEHGIRPPAVLHLCGGQALASGRFATHCRCESAPRPCRHRVLIFWKGSTGFGGAVEDGAGEVLHTDWTQTGTFDNVTISAM
jgi:hypothetical protein